MSLALIWRDMLKSAPAAGSTADADGEPAIDISESGAVLGEVDVSNGSFANHAES